MTRMDLGSGYVLGRESVRHEWSPWGGGGVGSVGPVPSMRSAGRVRPDGAQPIGEMRARAAWSRQTPPHPAPAGSTRGDENDSQRVRGTEDNV